MNIYKINKEQLTTNNLVHIDTYRLKDEQELINIGVEDYLGDQNTICVIEWPEKIEKLLHNKKTLNVFFESVGESERKIHISHTT